MAILRSGWYVSLLALLAATFLNTGCVTNGRRILLKEYGPSASLPTGDALKGATICIEGFTRAPDLVSLQLTTKPEEPEGFLYLEMSKASDEMWSTEMKKMAKETPKEDWLEIGNLRNGFGMVMSHVYALNDPAVWLADSLKLDLEALGATVVDASKASTADATVSGTIQCCRADMYMVVNGTLVVNIEVQPKQGNPRRRQIHTHGATAAMLASAGEYFHALRDARQKFSIFTMEEIAKALKPSP